jgi:hypothetical protein
MLAPTRLLTPTRLLAAGPATFRLLEPLRNVLPGLALRRGLAPLVSRCAAVSERGLAPALPQSGRCPSTLSALLTGRVGGDDGLLAPESLFHVSLDLLGGSSVLLSLTSLVTLLGTLLVAPSSLFVSAGSLVSSAALLVASTLVASVLGSFVAASLSVLVVRHL